MVWLDFAIVFSLSVAAPLFAFNFRGWQLRIPEERKVQICPFRRALTHGTHRSPDWFSPVYSPVFFLTFSHLLVRRPRIFICGRPPHISLCYNFWDIIWYHLPFCFQLRWNVFPTCYFPERLRGQPISALEFDQLESCINVSEIERHHVANISSNLHWAKGKN